MGPAGGHCPEPPTPTWLMAPERRHWRPGHGRRSADRTNPSAATTGDAPRPAVRSRPRSVGQRRWWPSSSAAPSAPFSRYLLDAHHPIAPGDFPWPTLMVNLTGSLAIGLLVPLTEHVAPRAPRRSPPPRHRPPRRMDDVLHLGRRGHPVGQGRCTSPPASPIWRPPSSAGLRWSSSATALGRRLVPS